MINSFKGKNEFLSNFFPGDQRSLEHKYQALKSFNQKERAEILAAKTPREAKRLGRKVTLRSDWEQKKVALMFMLVSFKFFADKDLEDGLLATGDQKLIEGNHWHDNFWGDCYCRKCENIRGKNILGRILMKVRANLRRRQ